MNSIATDRSIYLGSSQSSSPTSSLISGISKLPKLFHDSPSNISPKLASIDQSEVYGSGIEEFSPIDWYVTSIRSDSVDDDLWSKIREPGRNSWKDHFPTAAVDFIELQDYVQTFANTQQIAVKNSFESFVGHAWHRSWNFFEMLESVKKLTELSENWNACGGVPLAGVNFERSVDLLYFLSKYEFHSPYLYPSPRGGLIAELESNTSRITVVIDSDIGLLHIRNQPDQVEFDFSLKDGFSSLLNRLGTMLEG